MLHCCLLCCLCCSCSSGSCFVVGPLPAAAGEATDNDLQLAWENLESAKVIWSKDAQPNAAALADVHGLLGDVAMESDDFATALAELDAALGHLAGITQVGSQGFVGGWLLSMLDGVHGRLGWSSCLLVDRKAPAASSC